MRFSGAPTNPPRRRKGHSGQALAELAIILPVMLLMVIGIADLGRLYGSAVAIESAAREAADFGAFEASYWWPANLTTTVNEMRLRACTAAAGSHLQGYETTDPVNNSTCTNPTFACFLERNGASTDCEASGGFTNGVDCSDPATELPCTVHVHMDYEFRLILSFPLLPGTIQISRDSLFRISNLTPPPP